jgi:hypothetical protein
LKFYLHRWKAEKVYLRGTRVIQSEDGPTDSISWSKKVSTRHAHYTLEIRVKKRMNPLLIILLGRRLLMSDQTLWDGIYNNLKVPTTIYLTAHIYVAYSWSLHFISFILGSLYI